MNDNLVAKVSEPIRLKDGGSTNHVAFDVEKSFGSQVKMLIIEKVAGENNTIIVHALVEKQNEDKLIKPKQGFILPNHG